MKTSHVDKEGNKICSKEDGEQPKKDIPGYRFSRDQKTSKRRHREHVYEKVKTGHKDKEGNEIEVIQAKTVNNPRKIFQVTAS